MVDLSYYILRDSAVAPELDKNFEEVVHHALHLVEGEEASFLADTSRGYAPDLMFRIAPLWDSSSRPVESLGRHNFELSLAYEEGRVVPALLPRWRVGRQQIHTGKPVLDFDELRGQVEAFLYQAVAWEVRHGQEPDAVLLLAEDLLDLLDGLLARSEHLEDQLAQAWNDRDEAQAMVEALKHSEGQLKAQVRGLKKKLRKKTVGSSANTIAGLLALVTSSIGLGTQAMQSAQAAEAKAVLVVQQCEMDVDVNVTIAGQTITTTAAVNEPPAAQPPPPVP